MAPGQRIGLLGGSFNPLHEGHLAIAEFALKRLRLDRVWLVVTPGNPLKDAAGLESQTARVRAIEKRVRDPRIVATGFESEIGARFTADVLRWLRRRKPQVRFVWLMGADNLGQFHLWRRWRDIAAAAPVAVIDRPGWTLPALASPAASALSRWRRRETLAATFASLDPPAFIFLHGPRSTLSSTAIRAASERGARPGVETRGEDAHFGGVG